MSFKSNPFDRFSHLDPETRLNQFRKRFEDLSKNTMFADPSLANRWPNGMPPMSDCGPHERRDDSEEGIPIRVVHESSDQRNNDPTNDANSDSMSSKSSSKSHRSNGSADTSHSSAKSGHSTRSNHSSASNSSQPRVHHIPITVEGRDGHSSTSGYASEANAAAEQPLSRSSSHSSAHSSGTDGRTTTRTESPAPATTGGPPEASDETKGRIHKIPIKVESNGMQGSASPPRETNSKQKKTNDAKSPKAKSGPFVTRVPIVNQTDPNSQSNESTDKSDTNGEKTVSKPNPMQEIDKILVDLKNYENEVNQFEGTFDDKKYRYLDEMLTRCMIKLDNIETNGIEEVRKARKAAILAVNQCIGLLETKVSQTKPNQTKPEEQAMEVSTPEPTPVANAGEAKAANDNPTQTAPEVKANEPPNQKTGGTGGNRKETAV